MVPLNPLHRNPREGSHSPLKYTSKLGRNHTALYECNYPIYSIFRQRNFCCHCLRNKSLDNRNSLAASRRLPREPFVLQTPSCITNMPGSTTRPNLQLTLSPSAGSQEDFPSHMINQGIFIPKKELHSSPPGNLCSFSVHRYFGEKITFAASFPSHLPPAPPRNLCDVWYRLPINLNDY